MTAVHIQTASKLYTITGVGYGPTGVITAAAAAAPATAVAPPPPPSQAQAGTDADPHAAAVAAATAAMAAAGPGPAAAAGPVVQVELGDAELASLRELLEGAVLCNDSALNVVQDEATGEQGVALTVWLLVSILDDWVLKIGRGMMGWLLYCP
jgi:hypothetical protein